MFRHHNLLFNDFGEENNEIKIYILFYFIFYFDEMKDENRVLVKWGL